MKQKKYNLKPFLELYEYISSLKTDHIAYILVITREQKSQKSPELFGSSGFFVYLCKRNL